MTLRATGLSTVAILTLLFPAGCGDDGGGGSDGTESSDSAGTDNPSSGSSSGASTSATTGEDPAACMAACETLAADAMCSMLGITVDACTAQLCKSADCAACLEASGQMCGLDCMQCPGGEGGGSSDSDSDSDSDTTPGESSGEPADCDPSLCADYCVRGRCLFELPQQENCEMTCMSMCGNGSFDNSDADLIACQMGVGNDITCEETQACCADNFTNEICPD